MIIVAGHLTVAPAAREEYLATCVEVVEQARQAPGCLDFVVGADLVDPGRINVFERWQDRESLHRFRGDGPSGDQAAQLLAVDINEYSVG